MNWLAPLLIAVSLLLLGRAFYVLYVQRRGNLASKVVTWSAAIFVVTFWTWRLMTTAT